MKITTDHIEALLESLYCLSILEHETIRNIALYAAKEDLNILVSVCAIQEFEEDNAYRKKYPVVCEHQSRWWSRKVDEMRLTYRMQYNTFKVLNEIFKSFKLIIRILSLSPLQFRQR